MSNPNNCETCDYRHLGKAQFEPGQHCYMFRGEPDEQCMQHTGHKKAMEDLEVAVLKFSIAAAGMPSRNTST